MKDLTGIPTELLTSELHKRSELLAQSKHLQALERSRAILEALEQPGVVDALTPEHDRTSCTDAGMDNGYSYSGRSPRCRRCALLLARREGWPTHLKIRLDIDLDP